MIFDPCRRFATSLLLAACAVAALLAAASRAQGKIPQKLPMFPFVIPWDDAERTITDVSALNPAPLQETRRVSCRNGHFYDQTGRRVRFLGTNFTFNANFPHKDDAPKVAARLRKYGFNIVRLHHMDVKAPRGIFDARFPDLQHLDPEQVDRLDYLIYQFKQQGIYVDLNLHVARAFTKADGFPDADKLNRLGKVTGYFEPRMIQLQKRYARDLLTHRNPYTKTRYADEPTVALIELTNEDSLLGAAWDDTLPNLPRFYKAQLIGQWNAWLRRKYRTTAALRRAWTGANKPLGDNFLRNTRFEAGTDGWTLQTHEAARARVTAEDAAGSQTPLQGRALRVTVQQGGEAVWHLQLHQSGLDLKPGAAYTVQFWGRASEPRPLTVNMMLDRAPWRNIGLRKEVALTTRWKRYTLSFTANEPDPNHGRLSLVLGKATGALWLADLSLRPGVSTQWEPKQSLEAQNIGLPEAGPTPGGSDYVAFLMDVEQEYARTLRAYLRETLKTKALVTCSQASFGGLGGVQRESRMDFVDMHAYWKHPYFPRQPWDMKDWKIENASMVRSADGGTFPHLALHRVEGKPFIVSEYNHPAPNDYAAETLPMLAAYAAWQDWDGIFLFDYNSYRDAWNSDRIKGFFSVDTHPGKMALMPAAAMLFLRGDLGPCQSDGLTLIIPRGRVTALTARYGNNTGDVWAAQNVNGRDMIHNIVAVRFVDGDRPASLARRTARRASSTGYLTWKSEPSKSAYFRVDSEKSLAVVGFVGGGTVDMGPGGGEMTIAMEPTARNFVALTLTAMDGRPTRSSRSLLLTAAGNVENTGMGWNAERTSVGGQWGNGPTLAEGIPATITLETSAGAATVYALDGSGARVKTVPPTLKGDKLTFRIGPEHKALWYEIAAPGADGD